MSQFQDEKTVTNVIVFGCGAVGLYYGARLLGSKNINVKLIVRSDYESIISNGLEIRSIEGDMTFSADAIKPHIYSIEEANEGCILNNINQIDWIIIALKSTCLENETNAEQLHNLISSFLTTNTRILLIMNGFGLEEMFGKWFGYDRIFGGIAFICVNRVYEYEDDDTTITNNNNHHHHSGSHKLKCSSERCNSSKVVINNTLHEKLIIGHYNDISNEVKIALTLWSNTSLVSKILPANCLLHARWCKMVWNLPYSGLSIALGGVTIDVIVKDPDLRQLAYCIMLETIRLANTDLTYHYHNRILNNANKIEFEKSDTNRDIEINRNEKMYLELIDEDAMLKLCTSLSDNMGAYKTSTVLDLVAGRELEIKYLFSKPYERALFLSSLTETEIERKEEKDKVRDGEDVKDMKSSDNKQRNVEMGIRQGDIGYCRWPHVQQVVLQVRAVQRIARIKRSLNFEEKWTPTLFN